jgi:hypothetical protein
VHTGFWWGNLRERDHLGYPGVDGRIMFRWNFRKLDVGVWTGLGAPYCHLWPVRFYHIFPNYLINGTIFGGKKVIEHKMLIFSTTFV